MIVCFGPFSLNLATRQLVRGGESIHLSTKAFDLLGTLVRERPNVISKAVLQQQLWPETFVAEANLSNLIVEIRQALDDSSREPRYVRTIHRVGYAFCAGSVFAPGASPGPVCWVEWGTRRFPLSAGEHVIGRDADVPIRIDASTVSRRHAVIRVDADGAILEDFGSKNGTYRGDDRVTAPVALRDGDEIRIGSQRVRFNIDSRSIDSTETHVDRRR